MNQTTGEVDDHLEKPGVSLKVGDPNPSGQIAKRVYWRPAKLRGGKRWRDCL